MSFLKSIGNAVSSLFGKSKAKRAAEESRRAEERAKAEAEKAKQDRLKAEFEAKSKARLKELEIEEKKQQADIEANNEREKREHEMKLKELENIRLQDDQKSRIAQKKVAIESCEQDSKSLNENISRVTIYAKRVCTDLNEKQERLKVLETQIAGFEEYKESELAKYAEQIGLARCKKNLDEAERELEAVFKMSNVHQDNIVTFLLLVESLIDATVANQEKSNSLCAHMETFGKIFGRTANSELSIEAYWGDSNMSRLVPYLQKEEYMSMNDLKCDGDDAEQEFEEIKEAIEEGMKQDYKNWQKEKMAFEADESNKNVDFEEQVRKAPKTELKKIQLKKLRKACMNPETWEKENNDKIEETKCILDEICQPLGIFFKKMETAAKQAQLMLSYDVNKSAAFAQIGQLTDAQQKAITTAASIKDADVSIARKYHKFKLRNCSEASGHSGAPAEKSEQTDLKEEEKQELELGTSGARAAQDAQVAAEMEEDVGDIGTLSVAQQFESGAGKKAFEECMILNRAAIASIDVIESMSDQFEGSPYLTQALGVAQGIEGTCAEVIRNVGSIRQSIVLAHCLIKMKPAHETEEAKRMWNAVDSGIVHIFDNALKMSKVAGKYFGFFLRFSQSLNYYLAAKNRALVVSTAGLRQDIREFEKLSLDFNAQVSVLGDSAMECIKKCVENTVGAHNFEKNRAVRQKQLDLYLNLKKKMNTKEMALDSQYVGMLGDKARLQADVLSLQYVMNAQETQIKVYRNRIDMIQATLKLLRETTE